MNLTIFLDLGKSFDTVDHYILIKKLNLYRIVDRAGYFEWEQVKTKNVTCSMPQGSCLGPLLFIIYLNGFENSFKCSKASIYADDANVTVDR